jgi:ketosteroid isomerase-like protein
MSRENVEIVRSVYAAWAAGDGEKALGLLHPEITVDATRRVFNPATYVGFEGLRQMFGDTVDVWEEFPFEPLEFIDAGDRVAVVGRLVAKGKGSGVEVDQPIAAVWTVLDGRAVRWELGYTSRTEALEAVGLSEHDAPTS